MLKYWWLEVFFEEFFGGIEYELGGNVYVGKGDWYLLYDEF